MTVNAFQQAWAELRDGRTPADPRTFRATYHKPGKPIAVTVYGPEGEATLRQAAAEHRLSLQDFVDRMLNDDMAK